MFGKKKKQNKNCQNADEIGVVLSHSDRILFTISCECVLYEHGFVREHIFHTHTTCAARISTIFRDKHIIVLFCVWETVG